MSCLDSGHDRTWEPSTDNVRLHQALYSELLFNCMWGCWGKSVKPTYCQSSPKEFQKFLLPIFVLWCLSDYVGYHLWQTFLYECWHFWRFLIEQQHLQSPVERSQQMFESQGVRCGGSRQRDKYPGPEFLVSKKLNTVNSFKPICKAHWVLCVTEHLWDESILHTQRHQIKDVSKHALWVWNSSGASSIGCLSPCHLPSEKRSLEPGV